MQKKISFITIDAKWLNLANIVKKTHKAIYFITKRYKLATFCKITEEMD